MSHHRDPHSLATHGDILYLAYLIRLKHNALRHLLSHMECRIMSTLDDLKAELGRINAATNEIADDVNQMIAALGSNPTPAELEAFKTELAAKASQLEGIAAQYPPVPPTP